MENEFSLKELYDVFLKTTYPMEIAGRQFQKGETLCVFDKIQISQFNEKKVVVTAHGGFEDRDRVFWESTKDVELSFSQGIFNHLQFALLVNAQLIYTAPQSSIKVPIQEILESNENNQLTLSKVPCGNPFFYKKDTGEKVQLNLVEENTYSALEPYEEYICDYYYDYNDGAQFVTIGNQLINGFLRLEGKTRVKDDITGKTRTGIIEIPKLKLMSGLSMRLGKNANPVVANFKTIAVPVGTGGLSTVINIFFLNDDIDSDM